MNFELIFGQDIYDSAVLLHRHMTPLHFLPRKHKDGFEAYVQALTPAQCSAQSELHTRLLAVQSTVQALLSALNRPTKLIDKMNSLKREAERSQGSVGRSSRWPLGLLDDTRQRHHDEKGEKARRLLDEASYMSKELRYTQQTVASELAGWQTTHERMGRHAIREFARGMVVQERTRLDGLRRALRKVQSPDAARGGNACGPEPPSPLSPTGSTGLGEGDGITVDEVARS